MPDERNVLRARELRARLRGDHRIVPRPQRHDARGGGDVRCVEFREPRIARPDLREAGPGRQPCMDAAVVRRADGHEAAHACVAEATQVGARDDAAHAVTDERDLLRTGRQADRVDLRRELLGKQLDRRPSAGRRSARRRGHTRRRRAAGSCRATCRRCRAHREAAAPAMPTERAADRASPTSRWPCAGATVAIAMASPANMRDAGDDADRASRRPARAEDPREHERRRRNRERQQEARERRPRARATAGATPRAPSASAAVT